MALELIYFNGRGRAELARLVLAEGKTEYKDTRVEGASWGELKPKTPYGQLPVLKVGDEYLAQSQAIVRYLAQKTGLVGADAFENAKVDGLAESVVDLGGKLADVIFAKEEKEKKSDNFFKELAPKTFAIWEAQLTRSGDTFFKKFTYADIAVFHLLSEAANVKADVVDAYPHLKKFVETVAARPNIAAHLKSRPVSQW